MLIAIKVCAKCGSTEADEIHAEFSMSPSVPYLYVIISDLTTRHLSNVQSLANEMLAFKRGFDSRQQVTTSTYLLNVA